MPLNNKQVNIFLIGQIVGYIGLFNLDMTTSLGEEKLNSNQLYIRRGMDSTRLFVSKTYCISNAPSTSSWFLKPSRRAINLLGTSQPT